VDSLSVAKSEGVSCNPKAIHLLPGEHGEILRRLNLMTPPTIHEKISLGIIIVWSSKFPARKNDTQANFFKPVYIGAHHVVIFAIAQLSCLIFLVVGVIVLEKLKALSFRLRYG